MKILRTTLVAAMLATTSSAAMAAVEGELLIWIGADKDIKQLQAVAARFTEELGVPTKVELVDPELPDKFQRAASTGDGPDLVMWAHDRFGEWAASGLLQPVEPTSEFKAGVLPTAWEAVSFNGKVWGYPIAIEAIGLIYNKDLISEPPKDFSEFAHLELPEGVKPILWDYTNTYFTMPMLMANGGYSFRKVDGVYNGKETGVSNQGAIAGAEVLAKLFTDGIMPDGVDYGVMDAAMARGEVAMVINGPWSWKAYEEAGLNISVAPIPQVSGNVSPPFIGVYSVALNSASPNADLASEFIENYMLTDEGLAEWNKNRALGALADISASEALHSDKISATLKNASTGVPMPSNPEMGAFWAAMAPALGNITTGKQTPEEALKDAASRILGE
ncbi:maltose/maltodextrin ABC transporter substrate-binding protein MalE [Pseudovibrio ascidiaceicola]|uniref:maltose/maltodextrin ABC transporter substrate-binding protein MalE n=1 Tax=Pseudovibrio ascidiaceicola TaxID=285279 RepID=UPI000D697E3A|nr:maltose/maltodextrin ABC transporter substrate-binding protein MalE [Pseudovibrio ascidiaceicola]